MTEARDPGILDGPIYFTHEPMTLEDAIEVLCGGDHHNTLLAAELEEGRLLAELARLRAVDEAWRAVVEAHGKHDATVVYMAVNAQIARLDQLQAESTTNPSES